MDILKNVQKFKREVKFFFTSVFHSKRKEDILIEIQYYIMSESRRSEPVGRAITQCYTMLYNVFTLITSLSLVKNT